MVSSQPGEADPPVNIFILGRQVQEAKLEHPEENLDIPLQSHLEPAILLMEQGCGCLSIGGTQLACAPKDIVFINPGEHYSGAFEPGSLIYRILFRYEFLESRLEDQAFDRYITPLITGEKGLPLSIRPSNPVHALVHQEVRYLIETCPQKTAGAAFLLRAALYALIGVLIEVNNPADISGYSSKLRGVQNQQMARVLAFCQAHYNEKIQLEQLAEIAHMNKNYFSEYFKVTMKYSPMDYLNILRINEAKHLLETTDRKIDDIAFDTGYNSYSYFSRVFKAVCNITPSDYRKSLPNSRMIR